jgi:hypothetical protein
MRRLPLLTSSLLTLASICLLGPLAGAAAAASTDTIFGSATPTRVDSGDGSAVELGVKFNSSTAGELTGIRFYKASTNTGTHIGNLWSSSGQLLATATFTNESASGWQQVSFANPVAITAGTTYIASYYAPHGHYSSTTGGLSSAITNAPLQAIGNGTSADGVYAYGSRSAFPTGTYQANNYWVDVMFTPGTTPPPPVSAPAPAMMASPSVTGTATQGNTLTASNGSWSGSPTSYAYQWSDCNTSGANCTSIGGAISSSYTLASGDVGNTIRVVVTATNSSGSASSASAATAVVASGGGGAVPAGVSLQQIDGGPNYFAQFSNVPGAWDSRSFYPIGVFNQTLGYDSNSGTWDPTQLAAYKAVGINTFINLYNGYNSSMISAIKADGMYVIAGPPAQGYESNTLVGYSWVDEADGNNDCSEVPSAAVLGETVPCDGSSGRTPASAIAQVTADLHGAHGAGDKTRFVYGNYTKPVARDQGLTPAQATAYENAVDVISYDDYVINDGWDSPNNQLWLQNGFIRNVRAQDADAKPAWVFIEAGNPMTANYWSGVTATPAMEVAEAWQAIIGGARGIEWFDHDFAGSSGGYANSSDDLIDSNPVFGSLQSAVTSFDQRVTSLAPILNDPFASGYVTNTGSVNTMAKYDAASNDFYVFAAPSSNASQNITFTVAGGYTGPITVQGENRTLQATNGVFTDQFADQTAVHVYVVPN